jgi:hypothetical protein
VELLCNEKEAFLIAQRNIAVGTAANESDDDA